MISTITTILIVLAIAVIVFLVIREIVCWYSKINERVELQKRTNMLLENILKQLGGTAIDSDDPLKSKNQTNIAAESSKQDRE
jgi:predicted PurR-regulated permease PerM